MGAHSIVKRDAALAQSELAVRSRDLAVDRRRDGADFLHKLRELVRVERLHAIG